MKGFIIGLLVGLLAGGAVAFVFLNGGMRATRAPGVPIKPPDAGGPPAGTAQIVLRQEFFNDVLTAVFRDMNAPSFPLGQPAAGCDNRITILKEGSGAQTGVSFADNKIAAPLAFSGSYASMFGCLQFTGRAQASLDLRFDPDRGAVIGHVTAENVDLDGVNPFVSALLTPLVQSTLNERVNPILIVDGRQLAVNMPIEPTGTSLQGKVTDVRAEIKDNALDLYATYHFTGSR